MCWMEETGKKLQSSFLFMIAENSSRCFCSFAKSQEHFENLAGHRTTHWTLLCSPHHVLGASFTRTPMTTRREHEVPWRIPAHASNVCFCLTHSTPTSQLNPGPVLPIFPFAQFGFTEIVLVRRKSKFSDPGFRCTLKRTRIRACALSRTLS
jgi:hypothetical protein